MRVALLTWALAALSVATAAAPPGSPKGTTDNKAETPATGGDAVEDTIFNGITVPPLKEIEGDKFAETIKEGYW